ncbi:ATP-binding protein [Pacificispira sp.]|uniref:ATP-binding protein n=1 Tax=Pacificispira sp. TaxID=2888761 RepID=UPI003BAA2B8A
MEIETTNAIKLLFPNSSLIMVYLEAITNSFDAGARNIKVQISLEAYDKSNTLSITISDDGVGFTEENFSRFKKLLRPRDNQHKGLGRLVYLEYFSTVFVESYFDKLKRNFVYSTDFDGESSIEGISEPKNGTTLVFNGYLKDKIYSYEYVKSESLKSEILYHLFPTLQMLKNTDQDFQITLSVETKEENRQQEFFSDTATITKSDLPNLIHKDIIDLTIDGLDSVRVSYNISESGTRPIRLIAFSVDGRTIPSNIINLNSIPEDYSAIFIFESSFFNMKSDNSRQKLILPEGTSDNALFSVLRKEVGSILDSEIPEIREKNSITESKFHEKFPHLLGYFEKTSVGLIDKDESIYIAQQKFFRDQKRILESESIDENVYEKSLELSSRSLTEYVLYREKIIEKLSANIESENENKIHEIIVPRYKEFFGKEVVEQIYRNNAWLLDDKFMSFQTILSEKRMQEVISAISVNSEKDGSDGRPDIAMIFSDDPDDCRAVDVVVIELKKKQDNEKENQYAINQLLKRARELVTHCPNIQRMWYYAIMHVDTEMEQSLIQQDFSPLFSKGKVFYREFKTPTEYGDKVPTPLFVITMQTIVADARVRNSTFLRILREGMEYYSNKQSKS